MVDISKYKALYLREVKEHLANIESGLLSLEKDPSDASRINDLFRRFHSIKGMSASMGYEPIQRLAHGAEDLLDRFRTKRLEFSTEAIPVLFRCYDAEKDLVGLVEGGLPLEADVSGLLGMIGGLIAGKKEAAPAPPANAKSPAFGAPDDAPQLRLSDTMKVEVKVFDELLAIAGDLNAGMSSLRDLSHAPSPVMLKDSVFKLNKSVNALKESIVNARMLPVGDLFAGLPRLIRDIAGGKGKAVELNISGADISLDRTSLDSLASPVVHIIRNAVDHGIETADERGKTGKREQGSINITAFEQRGRVFIEISDDGRGINIKKLKQKAVELGVPREFIERLNDREVLSLACIPGITTADRVTETSGRGVGMDVVKDAIQALGGSLSIETAEGKGTKITLELPRISSVVKALVVSVGSEFFLVPIARIEKVLEVSLEFASHSTIPYGGDDIPIVPLWKEMGMHFESKRDAYTVLLVRAGRAGDSNAGLDAQSNGAAAGLFGIKVDDFGFEMDAYIRPLVPPMSRLWGVSGITIFGDGRPVFLVDVQQVVSKAMFRRGIRHE